MSELYRRLNVHRLMQRAYLSQPIASAGDSSVEHTRDRRGARGGRRRACARGRARQRRDGEAARARGDRARGWRPVTPPLVRMTGISKAFTGVLALDGVDLELLPGEIHALAGENGSGKSTLVKILYGGLQADAGRIEIDGRPVSFSGPHAAIERGRRRDQPGADARTDAHRRRERPDGPAAAPQRDDRLAPRPSARRRRARRARRPRRPASARRRALDRAPAGGRGGARGVGRLARARGRRGDELPLGGRDRPAARTARAPAPPRRRDRLHLAPAPRVVPLRLAGHRAPRRPPDRHRAAAADERARAGPDARRP